jgi:hypothetical protein
LSVLESFHTYRRSKFNSHSAEMRNHIEIGKMWFSNPFNSEGCVKVSLTCYQIQFPKIITRIMRHSAMNVTKIWVPYFALLIVSRVIVVTIDGVWIDNWIYWITIQYTQLQLQYTHFTINYSRP